ncbi:unnamed protein product [Brachionus calyciflorus]|uniref:Uncharacterized protein n=1 Tax=Brachionus calyciflorus TaxID=104777 RepID=A0A813NH63_9BILA|nr:unnamed protein product [Brachionus calyciflorus]
MTGKREAIVKNFINALNVLKKKPFRDSQFNVSDILIAAYDVGRNNIEFEDDERRIIGPLIKDLIKPIDEYIFSIGYSFDHNYTGSNLILRSGLQFILDNCKSFPVSQSETLEDTFSYLQQTESIQTLDEALKDWKSSASPLTDENVTYSVEEITRPKDVPHSHTWWY